MADVTEFTWLDTEELHLVGTPANGVPSPLLAKAAEALEETVAMSDDGMVKYVSAAARRKYAESGVAMPNGDFPIPDEGHLRSAIGRLAEYKGDKAAAKAHIIKRARALHLVHLLPKEWHVEKQTAPDKSVPEAEAETQTDEVDAGPGPKGDGEPGDGGTPRHVSFPHGPEGDGQGDTAPDKSVPKAEALAQTEAMKTEIDMTGDAAPDGHAETVAATHEATEQPDLTHPEGEGETTPERQAAAYANKAAPFVAEKNSSADSDPGSPAWEHKDVALGEKAETLVSQLAEVVRTFTEREKAEGGSTKKSRRFLSRARQLANNPTLLKECAHMSATELLKALDEHDAARRAAKKAAKKAEQKAEKKKAAKAASAKAAKAGDNSAKSVKKRLADAEALIQKMAQEPAVRPFLNGAGVTAALRGDPGTRDTVLKEMDDRVEAAQQRLAKASNEFEKMRADEELRTARKQRAAAKLIAADNARARGTLPPGRFGPGSAELFKGLSTLPEDRDIGYVGIG